METKQLYLDDSYQKEFDAEIVDVMESDGNIYAVLNQTLFYPRGGGQPSDIGVLNQDGSVYAVTEVIKREGRILHRVDRLGLKTGDTLHGVIDWQKRHKLMRMHTAAHLIDCVLYRDGGILATGNELGVEKSRIDFNMPEFTKEKVEEYLKDANAILDTNLIVKNYYLPKEEAFKIPGIVKLAGAFPPDIPILRITEIDGIDIQADGGTHVKSLSEIGKIMLLSIENKGKDRKRIYFTLEP